MAIYYKGDEVKVAIRLEAEGFSMDADDFDLEVKSGSTSIHGHKGAEVDPSSDIVIFKETVEQEEGESVSAWYAIIDTANLATGQMRMIATAHINDANANDGDRKSIAVVQLGTLKEP